MKAWTSQAAIAAVAALLMVLAAAPAPAAADHEQMTIFDPPALRVIDTTEADRNQILDTVQSLGADSVRLIAYWRSYAPDPGSEQKPNGFNATDPDDYPRGTWNDLDATVRDATRRGLGVLLTPDGPAPDWASRGGGGLRYPDPHEFKQFAEAIGHRYSGNCDCGPDGATLPRVSFWSVWNEPNLEIFLQPQIVHGRSVSGRLYRRLFLAVQRGLDASGHGSDPLLGGELGPNAGTVSTSPMEFTRDALCLRKNLHRRRGCAPIHAAGWSAHPYIHFFKPWGPAPPEFLSIGTLGRLDRILKAAGARGATTRRLPIYLTEWGVESYPKPVWRGGVPQRRQAEWMAISEYLLYENPWVRSYAQYEITDEPHPNLQLAFQSGLRTVNGDPKLSWYSFPMTLMARRRGDKVLLWGHLRPGSGMQPVEIEYQDPHHRARTLTTVTTNANGYFALWAANRHGRMWRATGRASDGRTLRGVWIRSYHF